MSKSAIFLITADNEEVYVHEPPAGFAAGPGERLETRDVSDEEYARLSDPTRYDFKLYHFCEGYEGSRTNPPSEIDFSILGLQKHEVLDRGLRQAREYYAHYDQANDVYDDLIVRINHHYEFFPYRMLPSRLEERVEWYRNDGTVGHTKVKTTHYSTKQAAKVHKARKEANVIEIKEKLSQLFKQALGAKESVSQLTMLDGYLFQPTETYIKGHEWVLIDAVQNYDSELFDYPLPGGADAPTVREYVVSQLTIPVYTPEAG